MRGYARAVNRVLVTVFVLNVVVAATKLVIGWRSGALSVLGDGVHSSLDALNNIVALGLVAVATRPADENHPYGHAKIETLGAFLLAGLLFVTAFELAKAALTRLVDPRPVTLSNGVIVVLALTLVVNFVIAAYERKSAARLGSDVLLADSAHTRADVFVTSAVLAGVAASRFGVPFVDPVIALGVAVVIAWSGYRVFTATAPVLTDTAVFDPVEVDRLVTDVPGVASVHDIRSRGRRNEAYVQMHLVVDTEDVAAAHAITDEVERVLEKELGAKEVFIHVEPEDDDSGPPGTRASTAGGTGGT